jgi:hypothetical protein
MKKSVYCPFCNGVVAPADSRRIEYQGQVAHRSCIIRNREQLAEVCKTMSVFLAGCRLPAVYGTWRQRQAAGRINSYQAVVQTARTCFRKIDAWRRDEVQGDQDAWPPADLIVEFRRRMSQRLMLEL